MKRRGVEIISLYIVSVTLSLLLTVSEGSPLLQKSQRSPSRPFSGAVHQGWSSLMNSCVMPCAVSMSSSDPQVARPYLL